MNEIKLTSEQADIISCFKKRDDYDDLMRCHISGWEHKTRKCLNSLTPEQFAVVLLTDSYEVEETFEVGDWVVNKLDSIGRIEGILQNGLFSGVWLSGVEMQCKADNFKRRATSQEIEVEKKRILWKSIDREVGEFKKGDAYSYKDGRIYIIDEVDLIEIVSSVYSDGFLKGFYPMESFIKFSEEEKGNKND